MCVCESVDMDVDCGRMCVCVYVSGGVCGVVCVCESVCVYVDVDCGLMCVRV